MKKREERTEMYSAKDDLDLTELQVTMDLIEMEIAGGLEWPSESSVAALNRRVTAALDAVEANVLCSDAPDNNLGSANSANIPETTMPMGEKTKNRFSFRVERLSDWRDALHRLAFVVMNSGTQAEVHADSRPKRANGRQQTSSHYFTWKQDDMQLTLSCLSKKPYTVTLHVGEGGGEELSELCWIDEDSLCGNPDEPIEPKKFALERIDDERNYKVDMRLGVFNGRMGSLNAACERENEDSIDLMLLLPFVN